MHEKKKAVLDAYTSGEKTVDAICREHGIARRTVYTWAEREGLKRKKRYQTNRKAVYMNREEVEAVLLMISECSDALGRYRITAEALEKRLLDVADMMEEKAQA